MTEVHRAVLANINKWFYFSLNYVSDNVEVVGDATIIAPTFFNAFPKGLRNHLFEKFSYLYEKHGSYGAVNAFYAELDSDNRRRMIDWFLENYVQKDDYNINLND